MAEQTGTAFRFVPPIQQIIDPILTRMSPTDREIVLRDIEPLLANRDRQIEDALSRSLACCGETGVAAGSILASEDFNAGYTGSAPDINGHALDLYLGGTPNTWVASASGGNVVGAVNFGGGIRYAEITNGSAGAQTGTAVLGTGLGTPNMQVTTTQNPSGFTISGTTFGLYARYTDTSSYLWAQVLFNGTNKVLTFGKKVGGSSTTYQTVTGVTFGANVGLQIHVSGSTMAVTLGSVSYFQADATMPLTGDKAGFYLAQASTSGCDNFAVYAT